MDLAKGDRDRVILLSKDATTLNNQAWQLVTGAEKLRDPARALTLIQQALQREPNNAHYLNTLGVVQYRNGQYSEAVITLEKSLAMSKGESDAFDLFFLAMCHAKLGDNARAKECFNRAVRWMEAKKNLDAAHAQELKAFRAEAEEVLQLP